MAKQEPNYVYQVTRAEYEQFIGDNAFYPECMDIDETGQPECLDHCPRGLVCTPFTYVDPEHAVDVLWYACAPPEIHAKLESRRITR